jgi:hypothetical protein
MNKNEFIKKSNKASFFNELDYDNSKRGCMSPKFLFFLLTTFIIIGALISAIIIIAINFRVNKSLRGVKLPTISNIVDKNNYPPEDSYQITISDYELTNMLLALNIPDVKNLKTQTIAKHITVSGVYQKPVDMNLAIYVIPKVKNGKVYVEVEDATVGGVRMIWLINDSLRESLATSIENYATSRINGKITDILLKDGEMTVKVSP